MPLVLATALLFGAVTFDPPSLPARGAQEAVMRLDRPAMIRLSATAPRGVRCDIADQVRGPFASSGQAGRTQCELELMLDSGTYKLRLHAEAKGKGRIKLQAREFTELNPTPMRLADGAADTRQLRPGEQASYWLHVAERGRLFARVYGRTAGIVRLWRAGAWVEPQHEGGGMVTPRPGRQIYEWWIEPDLSPGDYLLTVYGARPLPWLSGEESNLLHVAVGFDRPSASRASVATLPAWGSLVYDAPFEEQSLAVLSRLARSETDLKATFDGWTRGAPRYAAQAASCTIAVKALDPQCGVMASGGNRKLLVIRGEPGTPVRAQWGRAAGGRMVDGDYARPGGAMIFSPPADGQYLIAVQDVPIDRDSPPLSCELLEEEDPKVPLRPVASDFLTVSPKKPFDRAFNYDGQEATIWAELTEWGYYTIKASGDRESRCELFAIEEWGKRRRLTESSKEPGCNLKKLLQAGKYELKLYGGKQGIEKLRIAGATSENAPSATKAACLFAGQQLQQSKVYHLQTSRAGYLAGRGLVLRPLPLQLDDPLQLNLDAGLEVKLPITPGNAVVARALTEHKFACAARSPFVESGGGLCTTPEVRDGAELALASRAPEAVALSVQRQKEPPRPAPPTAYQPRIEPLPQLPLDQPLYFDFDREQARALTFTVAEAGLYDVTTEGLLATECELRTPTVLRVAQDAGSGRGRNCLLQAYLRAGRYLMTVKTLGQSRGRAAVVMTQRPPTAAEAVGTDGDAFFRAAAGELVQQQITVRGKPSRVAQAVRIDTSAQGAQLSCRLDDAQGWPVVAVPTSCKGSHSLRPGKYLWTQLPLTVESMRHTRAERVRAPRVLAGDKPHSIALNRAYVAQLSKKGKDEFRFTLEAEMDVYVALSTRMQARLYRKDGDAEGATPIDLIPPDFSPPPDALPGEVVAAQPSEDSDVQAEHHEAQESDGAAEVSEEPPQEGGAENAEPPQQRRNRQRREREHHRSNRAGPALAVGELPVPQGQALHLEAGSYRLVTEHSSGDVAIRYRVQVSAGVLAPGMSRELPVPVRATLRLPRAGTLRLRTEGDADVRCRIVDAEGKVLAESRDHGKGWNCALAEPLPQGDLTLIVESETLVPGQTRVHLAFAEEQDAGALGVERKLTLGKGVLVASLPASTPEAVQQILVKSDQLISCALEGPQGELTERSVETRTCALLLRTGGERFRLRLWTLEPRAVVLASLRERRLSKLSNSQIPAGGAALAEVARPGRYQTGEGIYCLPEKARGAFTRCGPEVPLEEGPTIFAALDGSRQAPAVAMALREQIVPIDNKRAEKWLLSRDQFIERERSSARALHLLRVKVPFGDRALPACQSGGGVRAQNETTCFAAAGVVTESLSRFWTTADAASTADVEWLAVAPPSDAAPLEPGSAALSWKGELGRYALPDRRTRVELTLPAAAWAVQVDERGTAVDLCPPQGSKSALEQCVLEGKGGDELLLYSPGEPHALATAVGVLEPSAAVPLDSLHEERPTLPGLQTLIVKPAPAEREVHMSGASLRCVVQLDDGSRQVSCGPTLPAGKGARLAVSHGLAPWRAALGPKGHEQEAAFGRAAAKAAASELPAAQAEQLAKGGIEHTLRLPKAAVVHLRAHSGVCALFQGGAQVALAGMGAGCELHRLMPAGDAQLAVRPFAGEPLTGTLFWTADPVDELSEGVGREAWVEPGGLKLFKFATSSVGDVGLGLQVSADALECAVLDESQKQLGDGCQQLLKLPAGNYLLSVRAPAAGHALRFKPVLLGLQGAERGVPEEYLRSFFARIGVEQ